MIKQVILIGCLAAGAAEARTVRPARLAPSPFADTEASTNVPCAFDLTSVKSYRLSVDFVATDSNNVVVAYGHDGDRDGCLALGERSLEIGWDCGTAFVRGLGGESALALRPRMGSHERHGARHGRADGARRPSDHAVGRNGHHQVREI